MKQIPIIFCIDVEPDPREPNPINALPWTGFEATIKFLEELRPKLVRKTNMAVHYSWFIRIDEQVRHIYSTLDWPLKKYKNEIDKLSKQGDEIGLHVHAWRWNSDKNHWYADHGNQTWIEETLVDGLTAYQKVFARTCKSSRFGDRFLSQQIIDLLTAYGVEYDLTLEPGHTALKRLVESEHATGTIPDYSTTPRIPFRPAVYDYRVPDLERTSGIWMIPISCAACEGNPIKTKAPFFKPILSDNTKKLTYDKLGLWYPPNDFKQLLDNFLSEIEPKHLAIVIRSDAVLWQKQAVLTNIEYLLAHPLAEQFVFSTPEDAINLLKYNLLNLTEEIKQKTFADTIKFLKKKFTTNKPATKSYSLAVRPLNQIEFNQTDPLTYIANGSDPQLEFFVENGSLPSGWVRLRGILETQNFNPTPRIYWDSGSGMSEAKSTSVSYNAGSLDSVFYLPVNTKMLRFDPVESLGSFRINNLILYPT